MMQSNTNYLHCMSPVKSVLRDTFESDTEKNANSDCLVLSIMSCSVAQGPVVSLVYCFVTRANTMIKHVR